MSAAPAILFFGTDSKTTILAAVINLLPGIWTLMMAARIRAIHPTLQIAILMGSVFIRLGFAVVAGGLGWYLISDLQGHELELVIWGGVFYVVALIAETLLVHRMVSTQGEL
ncbi:hypothetical protein [Zavarzinella formosa]|uniref:hypothetical protein n=1 Tax=Zavarzinella formosa TaxID=360055 RepID=UPI00138AB45B|nr:hypothetical protein [Zavarzinella formosa]